MIETSLGEVARALQAEVNYSKLPDSAPGFPDVSIDTRTLRPGQCFIAIQGPRFDGHDFVDQAIAKGAGVIVHSQPLAASQNSQVAFVRVEETTVALQRLAAYVRRKWGKPLIGITGSMGKTTTRAFTVGLLSRQFSVCGSVGNLNNEIGLPLSLCRLRDDDDCAVVEMGMNHAGEIALLSRLAAPDVALLTNVAPVHLEFFESVAAIAEAKAEILQGLARDGVVLFNGDDPHLVRVLKGHPGPARSFGLAPGRDVVVRRLGADAFRSMDVRVETAREAIDVHLPFVGRHYLYNVAASVCAAGALGLDPRHFKSGLEGLRPLGQRGRVETIESESGPHLQVMDESYNSNPAALASVLSDLAEMDWSGRKVAVLGDMLELGESAPRLHRRTGKDVAAAGIDMLVTVGSLAAEIGAGAIDAGMRRVAVLSTEDAEAAARALLPRLEEDDFVLVKASRGVGLESVVGRLRERPEEEVE